MTGNVFVKVEAFFISPFFVSNLIIKFLNASS